MQILKRKFLLNYQERYCNILAEYLVVWLRLCCCLFLLISILIPTFFYTTRATLLQDLVLFLVFMLSHGTHTHIHMHRLNAPLAVKVPLAAQSVAYIQLLNFSGFRSALLCCCWTSFMRLENSVYRLHIANCCACNNKLPPLPSTPPFWMSIWWV